MRPNLTIRSDNGLSTSRHQAFFWTNSGLLSVGLVRTNYSEILIERLTFSLKKKLVKIPSAKWQLFCISLNVLRAESCTPPTPHHSPTSGQTYVLILIENKHNSLLLWFSSLAANIALWNKWYGASTTVQSCYRPKSGINEVGIKGLACVYDVII